MRITRLAVILALWLAQPACYSSAEERPEMVVRPAPDAGPAGSAGVGPAEDPADPLRRAERWDAFCTARGETCGDEERAKCQGWRECYSRGWIPKTADLYFECRIELACGAEPINCTYIALGSSTTVTERGGALFQRCVRLRESCGGVFPGDVNASVCHPWIMTVYSDAQLAALGPCFDRPCEEVLACSREAVPESCRKF